MRARTTHRCGRRRVARLAWPPDAGLRGLFLVQLTGEVNAMSHSFPHDLSDYMAREVARGAYDSENDLVMDAVRMHRELKQRHQELRADIDLAIKQADAGESRAMDLDAIKARARGTK